MRHIIRIFVAGKGNAVYSGVAGKEFVEQHLGVTSANVPEGFLLAERRLDDFLDSATVPWSMSFNRRSSDGGAIVAYGCRRDDALDDKNRLGVKLIHAIMLERSHVLSACVTGALRHLSLRGASTIFDSMKRLAVLSSTCDVDDFLKGIASSFESSIPVARLGMYAQASNLAVASVRHDCFNAAAMAWLCLSCHEVTSGDGWEIYDAVSADGTIESRLQPKCGTMMPASELIIKLLRRPLQAQADTETGNAEARHDETRPPVDPVDPGGSVPSQGTVHVPTISAQPFAGPSAKERQQVLPLPTLDSPAAGMPIPGPESRSAACDAAHGSVDPASPAVDASNQSTKGKIQRWIAWANAYTFGGNVDRGPMDKPRGMDDRK